MEKAVEGGLPITLCALEDAAPGPVPQADALAAFQCLQAGDTGPECFVSLSAFLAELGCTGACLEDVAAAFARLGPCVAATEETACAAATPEPCPDATAPGGAVAPAPAEDEVAVGGAQAPLGGDDSAEVPVAVGDADPGGSANAPQALSSPGDVESGPLGVPAAAPDGAASLRVAAAGAMCAGAMAMLM